MSRSEYVWDSGVLGGGSIKEAEGSPHRCRSWFWSLSWLCDSVVLPLEKLVVSRPLSVTAEELLAFSDLLKDSIRRMCRDSNGPSGGEPSAKRLSVSLVFLFRLPLGFPRLARKL